jgi:hypothetical protein
MLSKVRMQNPLRMKAGPMPCLLWRGHQDSVRSADVRLEFRTPLMDGERHAADGTDSPFLPP